MKKLAFITAILLTANMLFGQYKIDTSFYSASLGEEKMVDVYFPPGYDENPNLYYPVIYYLHGWGGNQNSISAMITWLSYLINNSVIEPVIMVCADNSPGPFGGSYYVNSILWGDYEDYMVNDLIDFIDSSFRTISEKNGRALMGHSMGGLGSFRYGLLYPDRYCALAAHAASINWELSADDFLMEILNENSGPPYSYSFTEGGFFTKAAFLSAGAFCPNYNTPQTYIDPAIVEFSIDENSNPIDSIIQKKSIYDVLPMLHNFPSNETVGIFYSCGENDEYHIYPANLALNDTLDALGFQYVFFSHDGDHSMPATFKEQSLIFIDSLMMGPLTGIYKKFDLTCDFEFSIFPNPIKNLADISFNLSVSSNVNFEIIDLTGNLIQSSYYGQLQKGEHSISLSTSDLCEGIYFCRIKIGNEMVTKKIIKTK